MSVTNIRDAKSPFEVLETSALTQSAVMRIAPGDSSGPKANEHAESEQVLYIVEGELYAEIGDRSFTMRPGDSVLVSRKVPHKFTNRGLKTALTFNVYSPPAY
ncbi:MAG: cupin domain-containing protein [Candidatus Eremiobacteraeota bacterium]|nr:cupin domain-containing protein [Candidatus Eremiobacteraeota bacterium]